MITRRAGGDFADHAIVNGFARQLVRAAENRVRRAADLDLLVRRGLGQRQAVCQ